MLLYLKFALKKRVIVKEKPRKSSQQQAKQRKKFRINGEKRDQLQLLKLQEQSSFKTKLYNLVWADDQKHLLKCRYGLYIGNLAAAQDYQFLISNKFGYVINCTSEIPNFFEQESIHYLKFKLVEGKTHKLWDQTLKKLGKLQKFIGEAEQECLCCLIHSFHGENRSLVFITAYLMKKYQWSLRKCFQFLKSKQIFIGLSGHYIAQLEILEQILGKKSILSIAWTPPYINSEEEILSKTFMNSKVFLEKSQIRKTKEKSQNDNLQIDEDAKIKNPEKVGKSKRVKWLDRLQKQKYKQEKEIREAEERAKNEFRSRQKELIRKQQHETILVQQKCGKQITTDKKHSVMNSKIRKNQQNAQKEQGSKQRILASQRRETKKKEREKCELKKTGQEQQRVYQLTINNFINSNFQIINRSEPLLKNNPIGEKISSQAKELEPRRKINRPGEELKRPSSSGKKSQKMTKTKSQKEVVQSKDKAVVRDVRKQLKKQIQKVEKEKMVHQETGKLHLLRPDYFDQKAKTIDKKISGAAFGKKQRKSQRK